jgi:hypothetical protein
MRQKTYSHATAMAISASQQSLHVSFHQRVGMLHLVLSSYSFGEYMKLHYCCSSSSCCVPLC